MSCLQRGVKLFKELLEEVKQNADESIPEGEAMVKYAAGGYEYAISHRDVIAKWVRSGWCGMTPCCCQHRCHELSS